MHLLQPSFWLAPLLIAVTLALFVAVLRSPWIHPLYRRAFVESRRERLFLSSVAFFVTVGVVRAITEAIHHHIGPFHDVALRGRHIHHLVWGILLLLLVGYLAQIDTGAHRMVVWLWVERILALCYGAGAALTLDEFALWLNLRDVYWEREGRASLEVMALFGALLAASLYGAGFLRMLTREALRLGQPDK